MLSNLTSVPHTNTSDLYSGTRTDAPSSTPIREMKTPSVIATAISTTAHKTLEAAKTEAPVTLSEIKLKLALILDATERAERNNLIRNYKRLIDGNPKFIAYTYVFLANSKSTLKSELIELRDYCKDLMPKKETTSNSSSSSKPPQSKPSQRSRGIDGAIFQTRGLKS